MGADFAQWLSAFPPAQDTPLFAGCRPSTGSGGRAISRPTPKAWRPRRSLASTKGRRHSTALTLHPSVSAGGLLRPEPREPVAEPARRPRRRRVRGSPTRRKPSVIVRRGPSGWGVRRSISPAHFHLAFFLSACRGAERCALAAGRALAIDPEIPPYRTLSAPSWRAVSFQLSNTRRQQPGHGD